jgi:hypothetical protein
LRQKMAELHPESAQAVPAPVPVAQPAPAVAQPPPAPAPVPVAQPAPAVAQPSPPPAPPVTPAPAAVVAPAPAAVLSAQPAPKPVLVAPTPVDPESIAKAREALRQKMAEPQLQPAQAMPQPVAAVPTPPAAAQPAPIPAPAVQSAAGPAFLPLVAPATASPESITQAHEALGQKMKQLEAQPPVQIATHAPAPAPAPVSAPPPAQKLSRKPALHGPQAFPPIQAPPLDISAEKQQRLDELFRKYKVDEVTPEEYHQQRAKILAEP